MKKLMIAAATAAMIGGAFAAALPDNGEEVYTVTMSLKTTKGKLLTAKEKSNDCLASGKNYYRKQATVKVNGLIWGCYCEAIANPAQYTSIYEAGMLFWNVTEKYAYDDYAGTTFTWEVLNRIDTTAKVVEGKWDAKFAFKDDSDTSVEEFDLIGAGFGSAVTLDKEDPENTTYINSISGYAVGTREYTCQGSEGSFCDPLHSQYQLVWWTLCDCADGTEKTVAYGSWSIKFNSSAAKKLADKGNIVQAYNFPNYVF